MKKLYYRLVLSFMLVVASGMLASVRAEVGPGDFAPALVVKTFDDKTFDLSSLKGKVVLVHFWATWCAPCREEMPELSAFYSGFHAKGVELINISIDSRHQRDKVKSVGEAYHLPIAMIDDAQNSGFGNPAFIPVTYVVDKNGVVQAKMVPDETPLTVASLSALVLPLLGTGHSQ